MALPPLGSLGPQSLCGVAPASPPSRAFGELLQGRAPLENAPLRAEPSPPQVRAAAAVRVEPGPCRVGAPALEVAPSASAVLEQVTRAQQRMDQLLRVAETGKAFSPAELLSLQTHVYRASQELDLAGKVVEKATGGVKQVLQTQV